MLSAAKHLATRRVRPFAALRVTLVGNLSDAYNALPHPGRDKSRSYAPIDDPHHLFIFLGPEPGLWALGPNHQEWWHWCRTGRSRPGAAY